MVFPERHESLRLWGTRSPRFLPFDWRDAGHEVLWYMLHVRLDPRGVQRFVVPQELEVEWVVLEMRL